jgi:hypothetical protein
LIVETRGVVRPVEVERLQLLTAPKDDQQVREVPRMPTQTSSSSNEI